MLTDAQPLEASGSTFTDSDVDVEEGEESYGEEEERVSGSATPVSDMDEEASFEQDDGDYNLGAPLSLTNEALMFVAVQEGDDVQVQNLLGRGARVDHVDDVCDTPENVWTLWVKW